MPIITPAYPSMCATHNITRSTKTIITKELLRAEQIMMRIMPAKTDKNPNPKPTATWKDLFEKHTFFTQGYKYYLAVISSSTTKEAQKLWSGLVESKVRLLVAALEKHDSVALAHPYNKGFERVHRCMTDEEIQLSKGGNLKFQIPNTTEVSDPADVVKRGGVEIDGDAEHTIVYTTTHYIGLELREGDSGDSLSPEECNRQY